MTTIDEALTKDRGSKSPAFQFYPEAWLSSSKVSRMSHTEKGMYTDLLSHCWLDHGLPTDLTRIAAMLRVPAKRFERIWKHGALHECFFERGGRLFNARQERERKKQADYRAKQAANGAKGGRGNKGMGLSGDGQTEAKESSVVSISVSDRISTSRKNSDSAEPHGDSAPAVLTFPTIGQGPSTWGLASAQIAVWADAYPGIDVLGECRKALAWVGANQRKTARGMPSFLVSWLNRAVQRGPSRGPLGLAVTGTEGRGRTGAPPPGKYDGITEQDA